MTLYSSFLAPYLPMSLFQGPTNSLSVTADEVAHTEFD